MSEKTQNREGEMAGADDVVKAFGAIDTTAVTAILALSPTIAEIEEAGLWAAGEGETLTRRHQPRRSVAAILNIVRPEAEWEETDRS